MGPVEFVYIPKYDSWLSMAEIDVMIKQCLDPRIDNIDTVHREVAAWQARRDHLKPRSTGSSPPTMPASSCPSFIRYLRPDETLVTLC